MKKPKRIVLTGPAPTFEELAKDLGVSKREQQEIKTTVDRFMAGKVSPKAPARPAKRPHSLKPLPA